MPSKPESPAPEEDQEFEEEEEEVEEEEEEEEVEEEEEEEEEPEEVEEEEPEEVEEEEEEEEEVEEENDEEEEVEEEEEEEEEEKVEEEEEMEEEEEEEEPEEMVKVEEAIEEEEEMEEEEEEEVEEENDGQKSSDLALDSPSAVKEDDSEQEVESEDDGEESEKTETGNLTTEAHDATVGHTDPVNLSNEFLSAQVRDVSHETDEDIKPQILSNEDVATKDKGPQECLTESTVSGDQKLNSITPTGAGAEKSNSSCIIEKEVAVGSPVRDEKVSNALIKEEGKQMDMQVGEDIKVKASSSLTPQIRPRSSSPGAEFEDGNKRPAIVCDFFARGWCIKGSSCKFLHQKDGVTSKSDKQDALATSMGNLGPEQRFLSSGSLAQSSGYGNTNSIPYDKYGSYTSTGFFGSPNLNTSAPSQGIPALRDTYTWAGSGASQRSFDGDHGGYYSSKSSLLGHSSSPFYSRHDPESFSLPLNSWEPSVPFRPSFNFSSFISSPRNQYDPLLDSIDRPGGEDRSFQEFSVAQGVVTHNISHQQVKGDSVLFHQQPQYGALRPSAEAARAFVPKEENPPKPSDIANTSNTMEVDHRNLGLQADGNKPYKESKALKHFRASLVEFVKELVKPHWRDGHLSKDAHNTVVKKAVEKVLSAFQPHQIPNTAESTTHYLSSCRPKLTRLVEGYVGKYANA